MCRKVFKIISIFSDLLLLIANLSEVLIMIARVVLMMISSEVLMMIARKVLIMMPSPLTQRCEEGRPRGRL